MSGLAQKLFKERYGTLPWQEPRSIRWETLQEFLKAGVPFSLEHALAERLLSPFEAASESAAAFLCYLCLATRQGHLCVHHSPDGLLPDPMLLMTQAFHDKKGNPLDPSLLQRFAILVRQGMQALPPSLWDHEEAPLVYWESRYYLKRFWNYEGLVSQQLNRLMESSPTVALETQWVLEEVERLRSKGILKAAQAQALQRVASQCVTLITGGPGTGKTYCAAHLIALVARGARQPLRIALAAPTGKAAANLQASLGPMISDLKNVSCDGSKTLHSLLSLGKRNKDNQDWATTSLEADLIVVDESSMVDVYVMARLFHAVMAGARLVMLGDPEQLPSVQAGGVYADMVAALETRHGTVVRLNESVRTDSQHILQAASAIREGDVVAFRKLTYLPDTDVVLHQWPTGQENPIKQAIVEHVQPLLSPSEGDLLRSTQAVRLLTPLREGPWGVEQLNAKLLEKAWRTQTTSPKFIPIIITANDYRQGLFNGDVGVLVCYGSHSADRTDRDYAIFNKDREAPLPAISLPRFEYAYCLSVHRSQGSEYDNVMLLLPPRSEVFGRELLYTAVTRAKQSVSIWAADHTIETLLSRRMDRLSGLQLRLL